MHAYVQSNAKHQYQQSLTLLNQCDIFGQCGITPDFCTASQSATGAPGTSAPGTAGCISNCGIEIVNNGNGPSEFIKVGYWESFGLDRPCLQMPVSAIPSGYTHIHYAFATLTSDFQVDVSAEQDAFNQFASASGFKRILSFGGWSFSTDVDSFPIFRESVTDANRLTFAQSVVDIVNKYNLDGVDFDWEYPGVSYTSVYWISGRRRNFARHLTL